VTSYSYFGFGTVGTVVGTVVWILLAIAFFVVTAVSARKAAAGSGMIWGGGILMTLMALSSPTQLLIIWLISSSYRGSYNNTVATLQSLVVILTAVVPVIYVAIGVPLLIRGAVKAAGGGQTAPVPAPPAPPYPPSGTSGYLPPMAPPPRGVNPPPMF
jgi:hypothetical protein